MTTTVLILGATSDIGLALARLYAGMGYNLILAGRRSERLDADVADAIQRGAAKACRVEFDILETSRFGSFIDELDLLPDIVVCMVGLLGEQSVAEKDPHIAEIIMRTNYLGPAMILNMFAKHMQQRGKGLIIGVSSVAGERGRASNYIYGSAKAGFTAFLSGLRNRLSETDIHVMTVKPGFVRTRMTAGMKLPRLLTAEPKDVAASIMKAMSQRKNTLYVYRIWGLIMFMIRLIPENIFKRLRL